MACLFRQGILVVFFTVALSSTSCEEHPIGQMPEVQREQPDPAKEWSEASKQNSDEPAPRSQQPESPQDGR